MWPMLCLYEERGSGGGEGERKGQGQGQVEIAEENVSLGILEKNQGDISLVLHG